MFVLFLQGLALHSTLKSFLCLITTSIATAPWVLKLIEEELLPLQSKHNEFDIDYENLFLLILMIGLYISTNILALNAAVEAARAVSKGGSSPLSRQRSVTWPVPQRMLREKSESLSARVWSVLTMAPPW